MSDLYPPTYVPSEGCKDPIPMVCLACDDSNVAFTVREGTRRVLGEYDIHIDMKYCGICHTDVHFAANDLKNTMYPISPGHELAGVAVAVGSKVTKFKVGDHVGVGCIIDSCLDCRHCKANDEQYCGKGMTWTYNSNASVRVPRPKGMPEQTFGGYSSQFVVHERFAIKIPAEYPMEYAGPVFCAGITTYDPLKYWKVDKDSRVGILGLGGLGTMGVKLAKALGATVTVLSRSNAKKDYAKSIGADKFVAMNDSAAVEAAAKSLDLILDTVSVDHDIMVYQDMLDSNGTHVLIGLTLDAGKLVALPMVFTRKGICGSLIGGIKNTQEVIDLCAKHDIKPEIKIIGPEEVGNAYQALIKGNDKGVRYVLDISKLKEAPLGLTLDPVLHTN